MARGTIVRRKSTPSFRKSASCHQCRAGRCRTDTPPTRRSVNRAGRRSAALARIRRSPTPGRRSAEIGRSLTARWIPSRINCWNALLRQNARAGDPEAGQSFAAQTPTALPLNPDAKLMVPVMSPTSSMACEMTKQAACGNGSR